MKKKVTLLILSCLVLFLEIIPFGAALHTGAEPTHDQFVSFFHLAPFADGNFAPSIVAILSVVLLIASIVYFVISDKRLQQILFFIACVAMLLAFAPLFYCLECYNLISCAIVLILFIITMILAEKAK